MTCCCAHAIPCYWAVWTFTWGIVVKHSITHTDLQDEGTQQLLHMGQQGLRAVEETEVVTGTR